MTTDKRPPPAYPDRPSQQTIRQLRQGRDWSQLDMAIRLGVTVSTISLWERGLRVPTLFNQNRLARLFGVRVKDIDLRPDDQALQDRP